MKWIFVVKTVEFLKLTVVFCIVVADNIIYDFDFKVHPFKPHASRMESAEIFVVCKGFRAPDKLDPKFLDPKYVFQEIETEATTVKGLVANERNKPKAGGYEDGVTSLHNKVLVSQFISQENFVELLGKASEIHFDDEAIANHPLTTAEVKECCKDIKVLGRKDMKALLTWRKNLKKDLDAQMETLEPETAADEAKVKADDEEDDEDDDLVKIDKQVAEIEVNTLLYSNNFSSLDADICCCLY